MPFGKPDFVPRLNLLNRLAPTGDRSHPRTRTATRSSRVRTLCLAGGVAVLAACQPVPGSFAGSQRVLTPSGASPFGSYLAGRFAARAEKDSDAAANFFADTLATDPKNLTLRKRTMVLMAIDGRFDKAVSLAKEVVADDRRDSSSHIIMAADHMSRGEFGAAKSALDHLARTGLNRLLAPMLTAWAEFGAGDVDKALSALDPLEKEARFKPIYLYHAALINDLAGRHGQAMSLYQEALKGSATRSTRVAQAYGAFLNSSGETEQAAKFYDKELEAFPNNLAFRTAKDQIAQGKPVEKPVTDAKEGFAEALYTISAILARDSARDIATLYTRITLLVRPDFPPAKILLAEIKENQQQWEQAIGIYRSIKSNSELDQAVQLRIAEALNRMDRVDEAAVMLKKLAAESPDEIDALVEMGDMFRGRERFKEAADAYTQAIKRIPKIEERHWSVLYARGIAYERSGEWDKAEKDFLHALNLKPNQPLVLNYLGYSWVDKGLEIDRARKMIEKAVELRPRDGYIVDSLGWVYYRLKKYDLAVEQLERAVELRPEDPVINDHLGDAYWRVGRRFEARFQWRRALSYDPDAELIPGIEAKLNTGLAPIHAEAQKDRPKGG